VGDSVIASSDWLASSKMSNCSEVTALGTRVAGGVTTIKPPDFDARDPGITLDQPTAAHCQGDYLDAALAVAPSTGYPIAR